MYKIDLPAQRVPALFLRQPLGSDLTTRTSSSVLSPQPGVFRFGLLKNREVRVGVLPQFEEVLERLFGFRRVAREREAARHPQIGERIELSPVGVDAR